MKSGLRILLLWPIDHPIAAIVMALAAAALALLGVRRIHAEGSLEPMFARDSAAGGALVRIMHDFDAVDDLLVLAALRPDDRGPNPDRLLDFAARLQSRIEQSPSARQLSAGVMYRADDQTRDFFQHVLVPSAVSYLSDTQFAEAQQRLTPAGMRAQIERDQAMLATPGPAAGALAKAFMQDPLRLHEFLISRLKEQNPIRTWQGSDALISQDGRSLLIRIRGRQPPSDLEFCKTFVAAVSQAATQANTDGLEVNFAGSYAIAAQSARSIRSDMIASVIGSVICLQVLFLLAYRSALKLFAVAFAPIALGVLLGFGAYSAARTGLTPMTAALGGILAGMAIDYSIQYLSMYESRRMRGEGAHEAAQETAVRITPAAFAAWATSVIGFAAIGASRVPMLRDFSILGSLGLAGAFASVVMLAPMLLMWTDWRRVAASAANIRFPLHAFLEIIGRYRRWCMFLFCIVASIAAVVVLAHKGDWLPMESDLTIMHPRPNPAIQTQSDIAARFGIAPDSILVHLQADSPDDLLILAHEADQRLKNPRQNESALSGTYGLATLLPDPRVAPSRLAAMGQAQAQADRVVADFQTAMAEAGFNPDAKPLHDYAAFLRTLLTQAAPPGIRSILPYPQLAQTVLSRSALSGAPATEAIMLVFVRQSLNERSARDRAVTEVRQALAGLHGATPTGLSVIGFDTEATVRRELPRLTWIALGAVALYLILHFRGAANALLALAPTGISLLIVLAAMRLAGQKLNMVNLVALPLLIGIDVDYGIFLVSLARITHARGQTRQELARAMAPVCHAVLMCALATTIGFGSLATTSVPAVRSLGFAVAVGIAGCVFGILFLVVPILFGVAKPADSKAESPVPQLRTTE